MKRVTDQQRQRIQRQLTVALIALYLAGKQRALTRLDRKLEAELTPEQRTKIEQFAAKRAQLIQDGTNRYLDNAPNDLSANPTTAQVQDAEKARLKKVGEYNSSVLAPFLARWADQSGFVDQYQERGPDDQQWTLEPLETAGCDDECDDASAASPMSSDDASGYEFPAHPNCPHELIPV